MTIKVRCSEINTKIKLDNTENYLIEKLNVILRKHTNLRVETLTFVFFPTYMYII